MKKTLVFLMVVTIIFSLTACKKSNNNSSDAYSSAPQIASEFSETESSATDLSSENSETVSINTSISTNEESGNNSVSNNVQSSSIVSSSSITNSSVTQSVTLENISYNISNLQQAISILTNYKNYGAACEYDNMINLNYMEIDPYITSEQREVINNICPDINLLKSCHTINDVKNHFGKYFLPNIYQNFDSNNFIEYNNNLYIMRGAKGYIEYESQITDSSITRTEYNKISVITKLYNSGGEFCNNVKIDFEYQGSNYKIANVTDL